MNLLETTNHLFELFHIWPAATHQQLFDDTLRDINEELRFVMFELRSCINQYDGMVYYGVVNTVADEVSEFETKYSAPQITFYKELVCDSLLCISGGARI